MQSDLLCDELDDITRSYDYGIVPGSATIFVRDELSGIVRLDMILLEGVMVVIEISSQVYRVCSCLPLSNTSTASKTAQNIQKMIELPFESMDNLLLAISPMFREKFQQVLFDKLESVHRSDTNNNRDNFSSLKNGNISMQAQIISGELCSASLPAEASTTQMSTQTDLEELQNWINRV
ncbi:hypothetical protein BD560DRAFT_405339 [Blakeslea trispora]|nr:hypothetical protein BD560DRAFT_405339 [Blakeslea trispora]